MADETNNPDANVQEEPKGPDVPTRFEGSAAAAPGLDVSDPVEDAPRSVEGAADYLTPDPVYPSLLKYEQELCTPAT